MRRIRLIAFIVLAGWTASAFAIEWPTRLAALTGKVGKYEKIEFMMTAGAYANPYDPAQIDLWLEIQTPSGKVVQVPAFYMESYEYKSLDTGRRGGDWFHPVAAALPWRARYAPTEIGIHRARAVRREKSGADQSNEVTFECTPSASKGFVRVAKGNPRYFEFSEGGSFFPIGQDLAFIGDSQYVSIQKMREIFGKMGANGANYARVWACCGDWAMAIEARKSAFGRSWEKKSPLVEMPDNPGKKCVQLTPESRTLNVSPSHPVGLKPNQSYQIRGSLYTRGEARLRLSAPGLIDEIISSPSEHWTLWFHEFTTDAKTWRLPNVRFTLEGGGTAFLAGIDLTEIRDGGSAANLLWEADTNRPARGVYNPTDCFMLDQVVEAAEQNGIRLQLCTMSRDLYMKDLKDPKSPEYTQAIADARKIMRYAVARWGYSTAVASWEYWNEENPGLPTDRFYEELGKYLKEIDPYGHLRATSAWGPNPKDWRHPELDVADLHWYLRPTWGELSKDEVAAVMDRAALVRATATARPALLSEFGLANDKWGLSADMKRDAGLGHFHNALWASALSGLSGTAMFWWWEQLDTQNAYPHYKGVAAFVADIPFNTSQFRAVEAKASDPRVRVVGLQTASRADFWVSNREAAWHARIVEGQEPKEVRGATIEMGGLAAGTYRLQWWDTAAGKVLSETKMEIAGAPARIAVPPFMSDVAGKVVSLSKPSTSH